MKKNRNNKMPPENKLENIRWTFEATVESLNDHEIEYDLMMLFEELIA